MAFKKLDKEFLLTDNSVNVYGYRLLSEGCLLDRFKPAVGNFMHHRYDGVAVRWEDFRIDGDKIYAKPVVNLTAFPNLATEIEDGFYAAASVGRIVAIEYSDAPELKIEGQTSITVTKWFPREVSIVDVPGNYSALAQLSDESDNLLADLSDLTNPIINFKKDEKMKKEHLKLLDLADNATPEQIEIALKNLADKAEKAEKTAQELKDLQDKVAEDEKTKKEATRKDFEKMLDDAIKSGALSENENKTVKTQFMDLFNANAELAISTIKNLPPRKSAVQNLADTSDYTPGSFFLKRQQEITEKQQKN